MYKFLISVMAVFGFFLSACDNSDQQKTTPETQTVSSEFRSQFSDAVNIYFEVKDALIAGDAVMANEKTQAFKAALVNVDAASLTGEKAAAWKENLAGFQSALDEMAASDDVEQQRAAFLKLSNAVIGSAKDFGPLNATVYVQHCPMAFNNAGGDWLSNSDEILNPYFGDAMLHCGSVTETIASR